VDANAGSVEGGGRRQGARVVVSGGGLAGSRGEKRRQRLAKICRVKCRAVGAREEERGSVFEP